VAPATSTVRSPQAVSSYGNRPDLADVRYVWGPEGSDVRRDEDRNALFVAAIARGTEAEADWRISRRSLTKDHTTTRNDRAATTTVV